MLLYLFLIGLIKIQESNEQIIEGCFDQEDILRDFATKSEEFQVMSVVKKI